MLVFLKLPSLPPGESCYKASADAELFNNLGLIFA